MNTKLHKHDDSRTETNLEHRNAGRWISLCGVGLATSVVVVLTSGAALGGDNDTSRPATVQSLEMASVRHGDGRTTVEPAGLSTPELESSIPGRSDVLNPFDWAARLACRLVEKIDPDSEGATNSMSCDRWPTHGKDANASPLCDDLVGTELREGDLEEVFVAAFVLGLLADELG